MNKRPLRPITPAEIEAYDRDGVVCLPGIFDRDWIERLAAAWTRIQAEMVASPEPVIRLPQAYLDQDPALREEIARRFGPEGVRKMADTRSFGLKFMWLFDPDFRAFVFESPAAEVVGELLRCDEVRFYWDQIFTKEPSGRSAPTYWHTDQPGWPVSGDTVPSVWLPLAPVSKDDGSLSYVAGSHRHYDTRAWPHTFNAGRIGLPPGRADFEDWEARRDDPSVRFLSWDMEPGDVVVLHPKVYHGAGANKASTRTRVALSTRWFGDDIRFDPKPECVNTPGLPLDRMVRGAKPVDDTLFPLVWRRPGRAMAA